MCSLSLSSVALYLARAFNNAILPHSEHSLRASNSLERVGGSMMNKVGDGRVAEGGGDSPSALGEPGRDGGMLCAASWMSINAVTAFATT